MVLFGRNRALRVRKWMINMRRRAGMSGKSEMIDLQRKEQKNIEFYRVSNGKWWVSNAGW